jgi:hypothetical protein
MKYRGRQGSCRFHLRRFERPDFQLYDSCHAAVPIDRQEEKGKRPFPLFLFDIHFCSMKDLFPFVRHGTLLQLISSLNI